MSNESGTLLISINTILFLISFLHSFFVFIIIFCFSYPSISSWTSYFLSLLTFSSSYYFSVYLWHSSAQFHHIGLSIFIGYPFCFYFSIFDSYSSYLPFYSLSYVYFLFLFLHVLSNLFIFSSFFIFLTNHCKHIPRLLFTFIGLSGSIF